VRFAVLVATLIGAKLGISDTPDSDNHADSARALRPKYPQRDLKEPANATFGQSGTARGQHRLARIARSRVGEQGVVVELGLIDEDVRVGVRRHGEVTLANELADARPRHATQMQQRYPPVP
jgi:hypothetical protein